MKKKEKRKASNGNEDKKENGLYQEKEGKIREDVRRRDRIKMIAFRRACPYQ